MELKLNWFPAFRFEDFMNQIITHEIGKMLNWQISNDDTDNNQTYAEENKLYSAMPLKYLSVILT